MADIEEEYRRFSDFGLLVAMSLIISAIGCVIRYGFCDFPQLLPLIQIAFYACHIVNLILLWSFYTPKACLPWLRDRSQVELIVSSAIVVTASAIGALCFERI